MFYNFFITIYSQDDLGLEDNVAEETAQARQEDSDIASEHLATLAKIKQTQQKDYLSVSTAFVQLELI